MFTYLKCYFREEFTADKITAPEEGYVEVVLRFDTGLR